jgi:hypothetical protein
MQIAQRQWHDYHHTQRFSVQAVGNHGGTTNTTGNDVVSPINYAME